MLMDAKTAAQVMAALRELYPEAKAELHFRNPYETLIATILSAAMMPQTWVPWPSLSSQSS